MSSVVEELEQAGGPLRNIYWYIRASRRGAERRRFYRMARKEKARLAGLGFDQELIRLYCLSLADPKRENRVRRLHEEGRKALQLAFDF